MPKEKNATLTEFFRELFQPGIYKRNQGKIARQVTFGAMATILALGAWRFTEYQIGADPSVRFGVPGMLLLVGLWIAYRLVNMPNFADFLIAVEAEMNKVSWPSRRELVRSSIVVILTILILTGILFGYDVFWRIVLQTVGVNPGG